MIYRYSRTDVRQEEDRVPRNAILSALAGTIFVATLLAVWGWSETNAHAKALRPEGLAGEQHLVIGHAMSGIVFDLFTTEGEGQALNRAKRDEIGRPQWIDRGRRVARIPIEDAMDAIVLEKQP